MDEQEYDLTVPAKKYFCHELSPFPFKASDTQPETSQI